MSDPQRPHYVSVSAPKAEFDVDIRYTRPLETECPWQGQNVLGTITDGSVSEGTPIEVEFANTNAPYVSGTEEIWFRVGDQRPHSSPTTTTSPGPADQLRVIVPSSVAPGEPFDVLLVSLDQYANPANRRFTDENLHRTDDVVVARDLRFTGNLRVPVEIDSPGVYRFEFCDTISNAVRVTENPQGPYWGDIHIHTGLSHDAQGRHPYEYARRVSGLDFAATTEHISALVENSHTRILELAEAADDPGEFVTIPAYEPAGLNGGHFNFYFRDPDAYRDQRTIDDTAMLEGELPEADRPDPHRVMAVPHHTGIGFGPSGSATVDIEDCGWLDVCPSVEIYSHHGQSERYAPQHVLGYEFNRYRIPEKRVNYSRKGPFYAQDYWLAGHRFGTICSSDVHTAQGGRRNNGVAAVFADELTREQIFDNIRQRRTYGTTGERILVEFSIDDARMGEVTTARTHAPLELDVAVWGTNTLLNVEILRHRFDEEEGFTPVVAKAPASGSNHVGSQPCETWNASLRLEDEFTGPSMYYARITQAPVDRPAMAWTSPIWIEPEG